MYVCVYLCVYLCMYARTKTHAQTLSDQNAYLFNIKAGNNNESTILDRYDILLIFLLNYSCFESNIEEEWGLKET